MGIYILVLFIGCAIYVQMRGQVVHAKLSRRLTDHSNFLAPVNCLFYAFSSIRNEPYLDLDEFPQLQVLQDNWEVIRDEALALYDQAQIKASAELDDLGFNSFFRTGWKRFYLKWYGAHLKSAETLCPRTVAMIDAIPSIKGAMFAMLPPGARLVKHRDPFAGSLRYHSVRWFSHFGGVLFWRHFSHIGVVNLPAYLQIYTVDRWRISNNEQAIE